MSGYFVFKDGFIVKKSYKFENINQVVGPIDRLIRANIAVLILLTSFILSFEIFEFAIACGTSIYFFFTALTRWDPFYAVTFKVWNEYKDRLAIGGRF